MKKTLALILAVLMVLSLAACGKTAAAPVAPAEAEAPAAENTDAAEADVDRTVKEKTYISMVSTPMGQSSYTTAAALCDLISSSDLNIEMIAEESNGYAGNVVLLANGEAEFGMTDALALQQGYFATDDYANIEGKQILGVCATNPAQMVILVKEDSDIQTIEDIKGKNVGIGQVGGTSLLHCLNMLKAAGLDPDTDFNAYKVKSAEQAEMMKNDQLDVYIWCGSYTGSAQVDLVNSVKCRMIPLGEELIDKIIEANPCYFKTEIPAGAYYEGDEAMPTFGSQTVFFCRADIDENVIYQIVKNMFENLEELGVAAAGYRTVSLDTAINGFSVPLHPGAAAYYTEVGVPGVEEYVAAHPVE